jgi:hypothetical protein
MGDPMLKTFLLPLVASYAPNMIRHAGQAAAGALLTAGFATADESQVVGGAVIALLSYAWSFLEKRNLLAKIFA